MVPLHVDSGLYLLITSAEPALRVMVDGTLISTENLPDDSVLLLPGKAMPEWLLKGMNKRKHAPSRAALSRSSRGKSTVSLAPA